MLTIKDDGNLLELYLLTFPAMENGTVQDNRDDFKVTSLFPILLSNYMSTVDIFSQLNELLLCWICAGVLILRHAFALSITLVI